MPLPSPIPSLFAGTLALLGLAAAIEAVRLHRAATRNPGAVRLATVFLAIAAVHLLECALAASPYARLAPHVHSTTFGLAYGFGPAVWLLVRRTAGVGPGRLPTWVHLLPVVVGTTSLLSWFRAPTAGKLAYFELLTTTRPRSMEFGGLVAAQALILLGLLYAAAADRLLRERSREEGDDEAVTRSLERLADTLRVGRNVFAAYLPLFLLVQAAGWHTYQLEYVPSLLGAALLLATARRLHAAPAIPASRGRRPRGPGLYRRAALPPDRVAELRSALERTMERDRPFLDSGLDLAGLASSLGISAHQLSQLLNRELGTSFADYVNGHRVREAARILRDPARRDLTVLAVALEVGFRSKNTFNSAFRKHAGTTPSEYRDASSGPAPTAIPET